MATQQSGHETYYVPEQSSFPILATIGLFLTVFGLATLFNELTFGDGGGRRLPLLLAGSSNAAARTAAAGGRSTVVEFSAALVEFCEVFF